MLNIQFKSQSEYPVSNSKIGNAGAGYNINKPTIPIINYNSSTDFKLGVYNNNTNPSLPNQYTDYSNLRYHTNNPINGNSWVCNNNLNSNGYNKRSYAPNPWVKFNLNDSFIPNTQQNSQTFAYNRNASSPDGCIKRQWNGYETANISDNNLEQIETREGIQPSVRTKEEQEAINDFLSEMNSGQGIEYTSGNEYVYNTTY
jgi:hypothetical protein